MADRRCPQCGSPVTPFAAGCAICGADLEAHRRRQHERRGRLPQAPAVRVPSPRGRVSDDTLALVVTGVLTLMFPLLALLVVVLQAFSPMRANVRTPLLLMGAVAVVLLAVPGLRFGLLTLLPI